MKRYDYLLEAISFGSALAQTQQVLQVFQLLISLVATAFSFYVTYKVWKEKALKDGKIDIDEAKEIKEEIDNTNKSFLQLKEEFEQQSIKKDGDNNG